MRDFGYTIKDEAGVHARPAGMFVKEMQAFESNVSLVKGEKTVSCKKLFALMGLGIKCGETVTITAEGADEDAAIEAAQVFLENNL